MRPSELLDLHRDFIRSTVISHKARAARVFGSVLADEDVEGSDLDVLVEPTDEMTLLDLAKIECALHQKLGIKVDVITPDFLPPSFRAEVLKMAIPV